MNHVSTVGLDLAKYIFQLHGADSAGAVVFRKKLRRGQLLAFLATLPPCTVAMEACASAHDWGREIAKLGHTVKPIAPAYVKPFVKRQKNDMADAEAICEAAQRPTMRFVALKSANQQAAAVVFRTRDLLVRQRTQANNALRGHLTEFGVIAAKGPVHTSKLMAALVLQPGFARCSTYGRGGAVPCRAGAKPSTGLKSWRRLLGGLPRGLGARSRVDAPWPTSRACWLPWSGRTAGTSPRQPATVPLTASRSSSHALTGTRMHSAMTCGPMWSSSWAMPMRSWCWMRRAFSRKAPSRPASIVSTPVRLGASRTVRLACSSPMPAAMGMLSSIAPSTCPRPGRMIPRAAETPAFRTRSRSQPSPRSGARCWTGPLPLTSRLPG